MNCVPVCTDLQSQDTILKDFTPGQRDYIIHTVYPIIKKALVHYVTDAALNKQIQERPYIAPALVAQASSAKPKPVNSSIFTVYSRVDLSGKKQTTKQPSKPATKPKNKQMTTSMSSTLKKESFTFF